MVIGDGGTEGSEPAKSGTNEQEFSLTTKVRANSISWTARHKRQITKEPNAEQLQMPNGGLNAGVYQPQASATGEKLFPIV